MVVGWVFAGLTAALLGYLGWRALQARNFLRLAVLLGLVTIQPG